MLCDFWHSSQQHVAEFFSEKLWVVVDMKMRGGRRQCPTTAYIQLCNKAFSDDDLGADATCKCDRVSRWWMKIDRRAHAFGECTFGGDANLIPTRSEKVQPDGD